MSNFGEQKWRGASFSPVHELIDQDGLEKAIDFLFGDEVIGGASFLQIFQRSLVATDSGINPYQAINKLRRCLNLCRFFHAASAVEGHYAEAGVFSGCTARIVVELMRECGLDPGDRKFYLFDSFEGLPEGAAEDGVSNELVHGKGTDEYHKASTRRFSNTSEEAVQARFSDTAWVQTAKGWIPEVFAAHQERRYAFVHIDVDLYRPTKDCLDYFLPRMNKGGFILCDDYLSLRFVGARKGWDEVCVARGVQFVTLDNYQSLILC